MSDGWIKSSGGLNPAPGQFVDLKYGFGVVEGQPSERVNWSLAWWWRPRGEAALAGVTADHAVRSALGLEPVDPDVLRRFGPPTYTADQVLDYAAALSDGAGRDPSPPVIEREGSRDEPKDPTP